MKNRAMKKQDVDICRKKKKGKKYTRPIIVEEMVFESIALQCGVDVGCVLPPVSS